MSSQPPVLAPQVCPRCNAANYAHVQQCWLCHEPLGQSHDHVNPKATSPRLPIATLPDSAPPAIGQGRAEPIFLWLFVAIAVLAIMVAVGLGVHDRGLLTLFLFVLVPSMAAAGIHGLASVAKGETPQASKMFVTFALSALMTMLTGIALVVCTVIFLFVTCTQMFTGGGPR